MGSIRAGYDVIRVTLCQHVPIHSANFVEIVNHDADADRTRTLWPPGPSPASKKHDPFADLLFTHFAHDYFADPLLVCDDAYDLTGDNAGDHDEDEAEAAVFGLDLLAENDALDEAREETKKRKMPDVPVATKSKKGIVMINGRNAGCIYVTLPC